MQHITRITLCPADLTRIRIIGSLGPYAEAVFAVEALRESSGEYLRAWRRTVNGVFTSSDARWEGVRRLTRSGGGAGEIMAVWSGAAARLRAGPRTPEVPRHRVCAAVRDLHRFAVQPYWNQVRTHLESAEEAHREIVCNNGIEALFSSLGPGIRWRAPVLEIASQEDGQDMEVVPGGSGLRLAPSFFLQGAGVVLPPGRAEGAGAGPVLVVPSRPDGRHNRNRRLLEDGVPQAPAVSGDPKGRLAALLGRTRAAALEAVREGCTNGELARRIGVSSAAVSQHTAVLRGTGLIFSRRNGNQVLHTVTPLGRRLLRGEPAPAAEPGYRIRPDSHTAAAMPTRLRTFSLR
ncbi:winged helix-turn-helix domain-containing protein [Streptomyces sp. MST-110588]|uniref:ArsR/SmtB family transcription factor n=1 Tax=Streptomyces sp. MST-110588 TaxID=2833628 RepID=UPI001F5D7792|nr:winged helix-turn-helix domain-containing protein [Streptomyces sp. MST-110588]UNO41584.1 winged helix-turn-helix transcriptional regulator [Streptomyces sp. MST-110588]